MILKTYSELYIEFIEHEKKLYATLLKMDSFGEEYLTYRHLCSQQTKTTDIEGRSIKAFKKAIKNTNNSDLKSMLDYNRTIEGRPEGAYCSNNMPVYTYIGYVIYESAHIPISKHSFQEYMSENSSFKDEFKNYINKYFKLIAFENNIPNYVIARQTIDYKIFQLWKDNIIDTNIAINSLYENYKIDKSPQEPI